MTAIWLLTRRRSTQVQMIPSNATEQAIPKAMKSLREFHHGARRMISLPPFSGKWIRNPSTQPIRGRACVVVSSQIPVSRTWSPTASGGCASCLAFG